MTRFLQITAMIALAGTVLAGCGSDNSRYTSASRRQQGTVVIIPGIEGQSPINEEIRAGLAQAGVGHAMPIVEWGLQMPLVGPLVNETCAPCARAEAKRISKWLTSYRRLNGGEVFLLGQSGGGGMAVFVAEELARTKAPPVDGIILLSPSLSSNYDLSTAVSQSRRGIVNFYNEQDVLALGVGTTVFGNLDGSRGPAAGRVGFKAQGNGKLHQVQVRPAGPLTPAHLAGTSAPFVAEHVAPWIKAPHWPD